MNDSENPIKVMPEQEAVTKIAVKLINSIYHNLEEQGYRLVRIEKPEPSKKSKPKGKR